MLQPICRTNLLVIPTFIVFRIRKFVEIFKLKVRIVPNCSLWVDFIVCSERFHHFLIRNVRAFEILCTLFQSSKNSQKQGRDNIAEKGIKYGSLWRNREQGFRITCLFICISLRPVKHLQSIQFTLSPMLCCVQPRFSVL